MKTHLSKALAILIVSAAIGVEGAPPVAIVIPVDGVINPGSIGDLISTNSASLGTIFIDPNGAILNPTLFAPPERVEGVKRSVIVAGGSNASPSGGTLSGSIAQGVKSGVIVAGGSKAGPSGGTLTKGAGTGSAHSVIVAGGSTH